MITLHPDGAASPAGGATVDSGLLVVADSRADVARLLQTCRAVRSAPWGDAVQVMPREQSAADRCLQQLFGRLWQGRLETAPATATAAAAPDLSLPDVTAPDSFDALLLALDAAHALWDDGDADGGGLRLALALAPPVAGGRQVTLAFAAPRAALWLQPGSVVARLSVGSAMTALRWGAAVTSVLTSRSADAAAAALVRDSRRRAVGYSLHPALDRLDVAADAAALAGRPVLVVLLHGLFGTDVGTFDAFISRLQGAPPAQLVQAVQVLAASPAQQAVRAHSGLDAVAQALAQAVGRGGPRAAAWDATETAHFVGQQVGVVGWPHNSLEAVETMARRLAVLLDNAYARQGPRHVLFVCHSQGGLLARAAALKLRAMSAATTDWAARIAGIVTFGTPHEGAAITEPGGRGARELATYLMMAKGAGGAAGLGNVLAVLGERVNEGIEDLKPLGASTGPRKHAFVSDLLDAESAVQWPGGGHRPHLVAVGGQLGAAQKQTWRQRRMAAFIDHKLGGDDHDLVVETSSSVSSLVAPDASVTVAADHFGYFASAGEAAHGVDVAVASVWSLLGDELQAHTEAAQRHAEAFRRELASIEKVRFKPRPAADPAADPGPPPSPPPSPPPNPS